MQIGSTIIKDNSIILNLDTFNLKSYNGSGITWNDLSGNKNNGTLVNGVVFSANTMFFDGINDYVDCSIQSAKNDTDSFTLCGWVTPPLIGVNNNQVFNRGNDGGFGGGWSITLGLTTGGTSFGVVVNGSSYSVSLSSTLIPNNMYYIVGTYSRSEGKLRLYLNGIFYNINTCPINGTLRNSTRGFIIGTINPIGFWYKGNVSMFHVYNRVLNDLEILQNYNATKSRYGL